MRLRIGRLKRTRQSPPESSILDQILMFFVRPDARSAAERAVADSAQQAAEQAAQRRQPNPFRVSLPDGYRFEAIA